MANQIFSRRLRQLRINKGVSTTDMSHDLGMTKSYIYNIEHGYAYPSMTQFFAICEYLDIAPHRFMLFEPEVSEKQEKLLQIIRGWSDDQMNDLIEFARNKNR